MNRYFCTWPGCKETFINRSAWSRHEEALHYCPYQWICRLDVTTIMRLPLCFICHERDVLLSHLVECSFKSCATKPEECRTFTRKDQLSQHIKRVHITERSRTTSVPKELLSAWKRDNPAISKSGLHCGFCGVVSSTWLQRQEHVFSHLRKGTCKTSWWPDRLPTTPRALSWYVS